MTQPAFGNIFGAIMRAKPTSNYAPKFPIGNHRLILKNYKPKERENDQGTMIEMDALVSSTTSPETREGDTRGWPWFIDGTGYAGQYAQANAKLFIDAVLQSINTDELPKNAAGQILNPVTGGFFFETDQNGAVIIDPATGAAIPKKSHDQMTIGELLALGFFRGIQLAAEVVASYNKKTKQPNVDKDGKPYTDATWKPIAGQSLADIAALRAYLDSIDPPAPAATAPAVAAAPLPAPPPAPPVAQYTPPVQAPPAPAPYQAPPAVAPVPYQAPAQPAPVQAAPPAAPTAAPSGLAGILAGLKKP